MIRKKAIRSALAMAVYLAIIVGLPPLDASADTLQVAPSVQRNYEEYLADLGSSKTGAFAVSGDGQSSYFHVCENGSACRAVKEALSRCGYQAESPCEIAARNREQKITFEVVQLSADLPSDIGIRSGMLDESGLNASIVGSTILAPYAGTAEWAAYFEPDGSISGRGIINRRIADNYYIVGNQLCLDELRYRNNHTCYYISQTGNQLIFISENGLLLGGPFVVEQGNTVSRYK